MKRGFSERSGPLTATQDSSRTEATASDLPVPSQRPAPLRCGLPPLVLVLLNWGTVPMPGSTPVMVQDSEKLPLQPAVSVVNIPNENASVGLSADQAQNGQRCLKLHYHFVSSGSFQYLGIPTKVKLQAPVHSLHLWIKGDNSKCSYGLQANDASGITAKASCDFECRFIGPNAIGTSPAFWLLTDYMTDHLKGRKVPCDELDIIQAYGGEGWPSQRPTARPGGPRPACPPSEQPWDTTPGQQVSECCRRT